MFLTTIAAVVGIGAGVNSIVQSNRNRPGGGGSTDAAARAADPFGSRRGQFGDMLTSSFSPLTSFDPTQIERDPAYQFQLQQGLGAIDKGAAASGMLGSGNRLMDLQKFGQGLASNFTQQQFGRNQSILQMLGQFSGATTGSMAGAAGAIQNGNNTANGQLNSGLGNIMSGLGGLSRNGGSSPYMGGLDPYEVDMRNG